MCAFFGYWLISCISLVCILLWYQCCVILCQCCCWWQTTFTFLSFVLFVLFFQLYYVSPLLVIYLIDIFGDRSGWPTGPEHLLFLPQLSESWDYRIMWCTQQWHPFLSRPCCYCPDFFYITNSAQKYMSMGHVQKMTTVSIIRRKTAIIFLLQIIPSVL